MSISIGLRMDEDKEGRVCLGAQGQAWGQRDISGGGECLQPVLCGVCWPCLGGVPWGQSSLCLSTGSSRAGRKEHRGREFGRMPRKKTGEWRVLEVPGSPQEGQAWAGGGRESSWNLRTSSSSCPLPLPNSQSAHCTPGWTLTADPQGRLCYLPHYTDGENRGAEPPSHSPWPHSQVKTQADLNPGRTVPNLGLLGRGR